MNENIDLTEILKDCPKGQELYSPYLGRVVFGGICQLPPPEVGGLHPNITQRGQVPIPVR